MLSTVRPGPTFQALQFLETESPTPLKAIRFFAKPSVSSMKAGNDMRAHLERDA
jgi:hypothetical protein